METVYEVSDPQILHAIKVHTTGEPDMSLLDKIIYIADYIEPGRDKAENLPYIRKIAFEDLDVCMAEILHDTLAYLSSRGGSIDATTKMTYDFTVNTGKTMIDVSSLNMPFWCGV